MASDQILSDVDEYGFLRTAVEAQYKSSYLGVLTRRNLRWNKYFKEKLENGRRLQRFIRKGVPFNLRKDIWMEVTGCRFSLEREPNLYMKLINTECPEEIINTIKIDIPRTFPENIYFDIYKPLVSSVLTAYANHNQSVGYCQGFNYIAGLIVLVTKDEVASFWLLKYLIEDVACGYHTKTMMGLQRDIYVIETLVKQREPLIDEKIKEVGLNWPIIATKWLICIFVEVLPVETVLRIFDAAFAEGYKIIFRVSLAIVFILKEDIMKANDMTELADVFRNISTDPRMLDAHSFLETIFKIKLRRRDIEEIRSQFRA